MAESAPIRSVYRPIAAAKASVESATESDTEWTHLIYAYLASATVWLVVGTMNGLYLALKFLAPDLDHIAWLSFGRLRPVHTNTVFCGWASLGMIGLALYVVPKTSRRRLYSYRLAWISLIMVNIAVIAGGLCLMNGINNGGQEYREYIWPIQGLFALAVILTTYNLIRTIADRGIEEIYIA